MGLKERTIKGTIWSGIGTFGSAFVGLIVTIVLARHLAPTDFGIIEIILSIILLMEVFTDSGFSQALIKEKNVSNRDLSSIFILNLGVATVLYLALYICAPFIAEYYSASLNFTSILRILSLKLIIDSLGMCQIANFTRCMQFKTIASISLISIILSAILSFISIKFKYGIWAIVIYYLSFSIFKNALTIILAKWKPIFCFDKSRIKYFLKFGGVLTIINVIDKGLSSVESLCIGRAYSSVDLGYYSQAKKIDASIIQTLVGVVQRVTYPALAQVSNVEQQAVAYKEIIRLMLWAILPVAIFSLFNSELCMAVIFGEQWLPAAKYYRLFSIYSIMVPLFLICWNIFLVNGKVRQLFRLSLIKQILRIVVIAVTIRFDLYYFTLGIIIVMIVTSILFIYYGGKIIHYNLSQIIKDNFGVLLSSFIAVSVSGLLFKCLLPVPENSLLSFMLIGGLYFIIYFICNLMFSKEQVILFVKILKSLLPRKS